MPTPSSDRFPTVRTEGAILPADLLQRVAAGDPSLPGLTPAAYHLIDGEKLNEAANRAWNRLQSPWASFRAACDKLSPADPGVGTTRDRWLLPLFQELGYGRLQPLKEAFAIGDKDYPISHAWGHVPIHLVGCRMDLDKRAAGSPSSHSLLQELLNRSKAHLWGFVSNGLKLRILRDNVRLTRQAYVEFDLQAMFDGGVYADFALLWRLCHQSRVEALPSPSPLPVGEGLGVRGECWLEQWSRAAQQHGLRVLDQLRDGVEQAITTLGRGFLSCPANQQLRNRLRAGQLDAQDYYRQLLRLVYRLLFLFVAEDRELLLTAENAESAKRGENKNEEESAGPSSSARSASRAVKSLSPHERYRRYYSTARLRRLAERLRGTQHTDLYDMLQLVMANLGSATGCPELALPALGSFLFSPQAIPDLQGCQLANADLLDAVRALALTSEGGVLRSVDYRNLGSEELGSVYESLLELHPVLNQEAGTFELRTASGHERRTTGSYYTPTSLINALLDSALDPVLDEACSPQRTQRSQREDRAFSPCAASALSAVDIEKRILQLRICDPACGSGHFLIAAAHRIAKRLAAVRTGEEEPPPQALRIALRDVISHCIYGVDLNPMAVELCKVALWMEALVPNKPLSFLDHHIKCGNSLLGATPELLAQGIPDEAFEPIEGDDKKLCAAFKKQNRDERRGQGDLFDDAPWNRLGDLAAAVANLDQQADDTIALVQQKERRYDELVRTSGYLFGRLWADAWCAAFVWKKSPPHPQPLSPEGARGEGLPYPITERIFRQIERSPYHLTPWMREEIERLAGQYQFFHWHLEFPEVFLPSPSGRGAGGEGLVRGGKTSSHLPLPPDLLQFARQLRRNQTDAEKLLWALLRARQFAKWKFRRQHPLPPYVLDFYCHELQLAIELDGGQHDSPEGRRHDEKRATDLAAKGIKVLRFWNHEVLQDTEAVLEAIWREAVSRRKAPSPLTPLPEGEGKQVAGAFDVVLGNPPWERIKLQEQEFFAARRQEIANAPTAAARRQLIVELRQTDRALYDAYHEALRQAEGASAFVRNSGRYPLCGRGDVNTYSIFAELMRSLLSPRGRAGCIVPTGISTDATNQHFFRDLVDSQALVSLYDFENRKKLFPAVDSRMKFCLLTLAGAEQPSPPAPLPPGEGLGAIPSNGR